VNAFLPAVGDVAALADAIRRLTSDASLRHHLGAEGQRLALHYTWARVFDIVVSEYQALFRAGGSTP
jgi:glycosyltransferase involved in cell wall biosynthesis